MPETSSETLLSGCFGRVFFRAAGDLAKGSLLGQGQQVLVGRPPHGKGKVGTQELAEAVCDFLTIGQIVLHSIPVLRRERETLTRTNCDV